MHDIDSNPSIFDFDSIAWPPSLVEDAAARGKAISKLKAYERSKREYPLLAEQPSLDALQTSIQTQSSTVLLMENSLACASYEDFHDPTADLLRAGAVFLP
jgi:hypothetical protein